VTAGASAPEHLVNALLDRLRRDFAATVEVRTLVEEDVSFELPRSVKRLAVIQ
jgi:4-hydroxy-3-methylbut-2-en-1-yl diphosphate reductase